MDALDGNAIAGELFSIFGEEMTTGNCVCGACGASFVLAEITVYSRAPGVVGRCRTCDNVLLVLSDRRGVWCVDLSGFARLATV